MIPDINSPQDLLKEIEGKDIEFIDLWFTDIQGNLKTISISSRQLKLTDDQQSFVSRSFDGSSVDGMAGIADSDLLANPDWKRPLYFSFKPNTLVLFSEIRDWKNLAFTQGDWRYLLKTKLGHITKEFNYQIKISVELEFYLFQLPQEQESAFVAIDKKGYFDLATINVEQELLAVIIADAKQVGIGISRVHHEGARSQFEIELSATDPLWMADNVIALRHIIRTRARDHGLYATFMPKPIMGQEGCGMHLRLAIFKDGANALYQVDNKTLTVAGKSAVVGLCRYSRELMLTSNQWINSYKRFQPETDAPRYLVCSSKLRATSFHNGFNLDNDAYPAQPSIHITHPDAACNPYLAFNALISAALMQENADSFDVEFFIVPSSDTNLSENKKIPEDLGQALEAFENSSLAVDIWGKELCDALSAIKGKQWDEYQQQVSDWEINRYQSVL